MLEERRDGSLRMVPRNSRLFTPRDFDYSPYFDIIKCPHLGFGKHPTYRELPWDRRGRICDGDGECYVPTMQPNPQPAEQNYGGETEVEKETVEKTT
jgi:hypothetical protein